MKINIFKSVILTGITLATLSLTPVVAAKVEVKLVEPKKFRDIEVTGKSTNKSIEDVHKSLTSLLEKLTEKLVSDSETLIVKVTELDLAGHMEWVRSNRDMRIVRENDRYSIEFSYELKNVSGEVIKKGDAKIKEFLSSSPSRIKQHDSHLLGYMAKDLKKWADENLKNK
ncbi:DUF3016 domain-containing protein [Aliikangiella sp. IMCC44359]|uniref:DUF3016 domain-containing protein n=1 Tax=Aliikangiella sp. IMCC44359 TaxID=3459125 RepID=UPI00403B323E